MQNILKENENFVPNNCAINKIDISVDKIVRTESTYHSNKKQKKLSTYDALLLTVSFYDNSLHLMIEMEEPKGLGHLNHIFQSYI